MRITGNDWHAKVAGAIDGKVDEIRADFIQNAEESVELAKEIIGQASTPTGLARGQEGRVDQGKMRDAFHYWIPDKRKYFMQIAIGWEPEDFAGERTPNYVIIQDEGFVHVPDGAFIPAVHALQDARQEFITKNLNTMNKNL